MTASTGTGFKPPMKMDPSYFVNPWFEAAFIKAGEIVIVRHMGKRVFSFAQEYDANGKNLYLAKIISYKVFRGRSGGVQGYNVKTTVGELKLMANQYLHFVQIQFFD